MHFRYHVVTWSILSVTSETQIANLATTVLQGVTPITISVSNVSLSFVLLLLLVANQIDLRQPPLVPPLPYIEPILRSTMVYHTKKGICEEKNILIKYVRFLKT